MTTRGVANGKVILFGEHAVVYGVPAIAAAIDQAAWACAEQRTGAGQESVLRLGALAPATPGQDSSLSMAFGALLDGVSELGAVEVVADTNLPPGAGLGCSAALGVAIGRAVAALARAEGQPQLAASLAAAWEGVFHGNASGIDTLAAAHGGCIAFIRRRYPEHQRIALGSPLRLAIGFSGERASTRAMVERVAELRQKRPEHVAGVFRAIDTLVLRGMAALRAGDLQELGRAMDDNQAQLGELEVSTDSLERLCALARRAGAWGAKLTGSGGGGSVVALVDEDSAKGVLDAWAQAGFSGFVSVVRGSSTGLDAGLGRGEAQSING